MSGLLQQLEGLPVGSRHALGEVLDQLPWNEAGLIAAIAQQHDSREVLMMAWMNRRALEHTLSSRQVCYWSRSRQCLWHKGETSGHRQHLLEARLDCDGDCLLLLVNQQGPACHTGRPNCFYLGIRQQQVEILTSPVHTAAQPRR